MCVHMLAACLLARPGPPPDLLALRMHPQAFPRLTLPESCMVEAAKTGKAPDFVYCMSLLDSTGIVTVPGSGFGQVCIIGRTGLAPVADREVCAHTRRNRAPSTCAPPSCPLRRTWLLLQSSCAPFTRGLS